MGHTTGWQQWGLPTSFVFYHVQEHAILFTSGEVGGNAVSAKK